VLAKFQKIHSGVHQGQAETEVWMCFQCVFGWFSVGFWGPIVLAEFRRNSRLGAKRWPNQLSRAKGKKCILASASEQVAQHLSVFILSECDSENSHKYGYISWHFEFSTTTFILNCIVILKAGASFSGCPRAAKDVYSTIYSVNLPPGVFGLLLSACQANEFTSRTKQKK